MKNLFVTYEIAKALKDKGYTQMCFAKYLEPDKDKEIKNLITNNPNQPWFNFNGMFVEPNNTDSNILISAPLYQQLIDWFEETYNIKIDWGKGENPTNYYPIIIDYNNKCEHNWKHLPSHWCDTKHMVINKSIEEALRLI